MQVVESIADMLLDDVLQQSAAGETCMACLSLLGLQCLLLFGQSCHWEKTFLMHVV